MRRIFDLIEQVGPVGSGVLIEGETGTGKELVAQAIHAADIRRAGPFVAINCAVFNDGLLESELFGHERGAFTGAERRKLGRFELANRGTLLLDEIGDIPPGLQAKLLRVLQTGMFERLGGTETIKVDVRIVAATNKRLEEEVKKGRFRADLFFRINVIRIELPPLRERTEDIPLLAMHFVENCRSAQGTGVAEIGSEAMQALLRYGWPGNVRELENAIRAGVALADGSVLRREDLPEWVAPRTVETVRGDSLLDVDRALPDLTAELIGRIEREYFVKVLSHHNGNVARCARHSGLSRRSVTQKLQKYGLKRSQFKRPLGNGQPRARPERRSASARTQSPGTFPRPAAYWANTRQILAPAKACPVCQVCRVWGRKQRRWGRAGAFRSDGGRKRTVAPWLSGPVITTSSGALPRKTALSFVRFALVVV